MRKLVLTAVVLATAVLGNAFAADLDFVKFIKDTSTITPEAKAEMVECICRAGNYKEALKINKDITKEAYANLVINKTLKKLVDNGRDKFEF